MYLLLTETSQLIPVMVSVNLTIGHLADDTAMILWNSFTLLRTLNMPLYSSDHSFKLRLPLHLTLEGRENAVSDSANGGGGVVTGGPDVSISSTSESTAGNERKNK